ncbi:MAG: hypothetical protein GTN98_15275 [Woeseiaceae bacterium]|nr:hypothetical protein [Woeseiaceae bacterium]
MNKLAIIAVVLLVAAAIWLYDDQQNPAPEPTDAPQAAAAPRNAPADDAPVLSVDGNVVTESFDDGTEMVLGIRVRKDRNCKVELKDYVTPDGEMFSAYTCTPFEPATPHPYADYTDDTLAELAYADAEAAALLGQRLVGRDRDKSYQLLIRATALDGDTRHLAWLSTMAFPGYRVDGELQVDDVKAQYELEALATRLGKDPALANFLRNELLGAGVDTAQLDLLDSRVDELLDTVRDIQLTVYGEVRYGGQDDA